MKDCDKAKFATRTARYLGWQINGESRGEALLFDVPSGAERAVRPRCHISCGGNRLPVRSRCGRGDLLCLLNLTPEKNTLVWGFNYTCGM